MPAETRNYLPKLQAVKNIIADPERFGIVLADIPDSPYFTVVKTTREMDVKVAAGLAEMSVDEFLTLNPQHNRPVIAGSDQHSILLPIDRAEVFAAKLELTQQPLVTWQAYRVRQGETVAQIATKFALSVETLRSVNGLGTRQRLPAGHALLVPAQRPSDATGPSPSSTRCSRQSRRAARSITRCGTARRWPRSRGATASARTTCGAGTPRAEQRARGQRLRVTDRRRDRRQGAQARRRGAARARVRHDPAARRAGRAHGADVAPATMARPR
jgi:membrane-bound lytic murein transglycosylase D